MPRYKKRDPEYTAVQFTGSNIREVMEELGPEFSTIYDLDIKGATSFNLTGYGCTISVWRDAWIVVDRDREKWHEYKADDFEFAFEPVKRVGRPPKPKEKK